MKRSLLVILFIGLLAACAQATTLQLIPSSGTVAGSPGATVGWGFTITNATDFVLVTGSEFLPAPLSSEGTYQDFTGSQLIVVGPSPESTSVTEAFDAGSQSGLGEFVIANSAAVGPIDGDLVVHYALFSVSPNDPTFDPGADLLLADGSLSASAEVNVVAAPTPEPASMMLIVGAMPLLIGMCRRSRKRD